MPISSPVSTVPRSGARGVAGLVLAALFWAGNYVFGAIAVTSMDPFSLTLLRWAGALVPLLVLAQLIERPNWRALLRHWRFLALRGALGLAGYSLLLYLALAHTTALAASLINAANPALIAIAARVWLGDRLTRRGIAGVLVALLGVLVVLTDGDVAALVGKPLGLGDLAMLGAIAAWTAYTIAARLGPELPPTSATAMEAALVVVGMAVIAPFVGVTAPQSAAAAWSLAFIVVFPSCASYVLWNRSLAIVRPAVAGVSLNLITVFAVAASVFLGVPITAAQGVGGIVVIAGVVLTSLSGRPDPVTNPTGESPAGPVGVADAVQKLL